MKRGTTAAYCEFGSWRGPEDVEVAERDRLEAVDAVEADAVALRGELRHRVGRDRVGLLRLGARQGPGVAVDRRRRGVDDAAHVLVARREQDVQRPLDRDRARRQRILHRARHRRQRALVEDELDAANRVVDALVAAQLPLDDLDVVLQPGEVRAVAGGEVVEHANGVAALEERANEVRADEAGSAGDEDDATHAGDVIRSPARPCGTREGAAAAESDHQPEDRRQRAAAEEGGADQRAGESRGPSERNIGGGLVRIAARPGARDLDRRADGDHAEHQEEERADDPELVEHLVVRSAGG